MQQRLEHPCVALVRRTGISSPVLDLGPRLRCADDFQPTINREEFGEDALAGLSESGGE
jgi:hypothetical protein